MRKLLCLFYCLFFFALTYSQTSTEKYNSLLERYEYFDNEGNLTGYKSYNSILEVWEYYKVEVNNYKPKKIEYSGQIKDDNFELLRQTAIQMDRSYNYNNQKNKGSNSYNNKKNWADKMLIENENEFYKYDKKLWDKIKIKS